MWHCEAEPSVFLTQDSRARSRSGMELMSAREARGRVEPEYVDETLAAGCEEAVRGSVEKEVVHVTVYRRLGDTLSALRVESKQACGLAAADEEAMLLFVESHREVRTYAFQRPRCHHFARDTIHDCDLLRIRHVYKNPRTVIFLLERLGVIRQRDTAR